MKFKEIHTAVTQKVPQRLQEYGVGVFSTISSKSALKKALKKNLISVDGVIATTATFIKGGEKIEYRKLEKVENKRLQLNLEVLYEDDYLAIINKPAGILVSGNNFKTVTNALEQNLKISAALDAVTPKAVHRLDYPTTGLLLVGKTSESIIKLNKLFEEKQIQKTYYAITIGVMAVEGYIDMSIDNKVATSIFKVITSVTSKRFGFLNLVKLSPKTGRRHQLRKHLFSIGNPILGDATYFLPGLALKGKGLYLHAQSLCFRHPILNKDVYVSSKLPKKFKKIFDINSLK